MNIQFTGKLVRDSFISFGLYTEDSNDIDFRATNQPFGSRVILLNRSTGLDPDISEKVKHFVSTMEEMDDVVFTEYITNIIPIIPETLVSFIISAVSQEYEMRQTLKEDTQGLSYFRKSLQVLKALSIHHNDSFVNRLPLAERLQTIIFSEERKGVERNSHLYIDTLELACDVLRRLSSLVAESIECSIETIDLKTLSLLEIFSYFCFIGAETILKQSFSSDQQKFRRFLVNKAKTELEKEATVDIVSIVNYMDRKVSTI